MLLPAVTVSKKNGETWVIQEILHVRTVLTADNKAQLLGTTMPYFSFIRSIIQTQRLPTGANDHIAETMVVRFHFTPEYGTCTTPNATVKLSMVNQSEFSGIGSHSGETEFALVFSNCARLMNRISYRLMASTSDDPQVPTNSTLPLLAGSTASGYGVQILDANGTPHPFDVLRVLPGYNTETRAPQYTVTMKARYIQTAANPTPGTVRAAMFFHVIYK